MAKHTIIKRIPPVPIAIAIGLVNLVIGLILGIINVISVLRINSILQDALVKYAGISATNVLPISNQILMVIAFPISGFIVGFLGTIIVVWIYNMVATKNPIKVELK